MKKKISLKVIYMSELFQFLFAIVLIISLFFNFSAYLGDIEKSKYEIKDYVTYERDGKVCSGVIVGIIYTREVYSLAFATKLSRDDGVKYRIHEGHCLLTYDIEDKNTILIKEKQIAYKSNGKKEE